MPMPMPLSVVMEDLSGAWERMRNSFATWQLTLEDLNVLIFESMTKGQRRRYVKRMVREEIWRRRHGRRN